MPWLLSTVLQQTLECTARASELWSSRGLCPGVGPSVLPPRTVQPSERQQQPATQVLTTSGAHLCHSAMSGICISSCIRYGFSVSRQISAFDHACLPGGTLRFREIKDPAPNHTTQRGLGRMWSQAVWPHGLRTWHLLQFKDQSNSLLERSPWSPPPPFQVLNKIHMLLLVGKSH